MKASMEKKACLVYISPAGTTRETVKKIAALLEKQEFIVNELDLARLKNGESDRFIREELPRASLLLVGSPTYASHILYPIERFIENLPETDGTPALAFSTFGGVSKGVALVQLTEALQRKGYRVKGAAKVLCRHSLYFRARRPMAQGHPDEGDFKVLEEWLDAVASRLDKDDPCALDPAFLRPGNPIPRLLASTVMNMSVFGAVMPKYRFRPERCTDCAACRKKCPTGRLDDLPPGKSVGGCLYCMECVAACQSGAFDAPMWLIQPMIRFMQVLSSRWEEQRTKYYLACR